jgi:hypothetical protein
LNDAQVKTKAIVSFSRTAPSPRYLELQSLYRTMHEKGEAFLCIPPEMTFPGNSLLPQEGRIKRLIDQTKAQTILDYGSGKGKQYEPRLIKDESGKQWPSIIDYWDVDEIACYDPSYEPYSKLPEGKFDGVISTDVLEHCPEQDVPWIIDEIFGYATRFVFANVACYPALKRLPNGENAHCTIKPAEWWEALFRQSGTQRPGIVWEAWIESQIETPKGPKEIEKKFMGGSAGTGTRLAY